MKLRSLALVALALFALGSASAAAQSYPSKAVRVIVPYPAGGTVDTVARAFGQKFSDAWGQPMVVDNRAGAGGNIGTDAVAKSAPDGHTALLTVQAHAISPNVYRKLPFDVIKDFTPISQITSSYLLMVGVPRLPASLRDVIALAKAKPGSLNLGSTGPGSAPHFAGELLSSLADVKIQHVPYKGDAPLMPALLADEVQIAFVPMFAGLPHVKSGKLRALAMTGVKRSATIPDVPTMPEAGVPGYELAGWLGYFGPAGMPREAVMRFNAEAAKIVRMPDMLARLPGWGYEPVGGTPEELDAKVRADLAKFARLVKQASIPLLD
jgi:tripartite-type tricarboxylate transporter receptor subunit TctC